MQNAWNELLVGAFGEPWMHEPCEEVVRRIKRRSSRARIEDVVQDTHAHSIEDLLQVVGEAFAGRAFRRIRADLDDALNRFLEGRARGEGKPQAPRSRPMSLVPPASSSAAPLEAIEKFYSEVRRRWPCLSEFRLGDFLDSDADAHRRSLAAAVAEARSGQLAPHECAQLLDVLAGLTRLAPEEALTPPDDPALARLDGLLAGLEAELGPNVVPMNLPLRAQICVEDRGRLHIRVDFWRPASMPTVVFPIPWRGPLGRVDVELASGPELSEGPGIDLAIGAACRLLRQNARSPQADQTHALKPYLEQAPWEMLFDHTPEAQLEGPVSEMWWSIDPDDLFDIRLLVRRRSKRPPHDWLKLKLAKAVDVQQCSVDATERAMAGLGLRSEGSYRPYDFDLGRWAAIYEHLVGHPRVCLDADPDQRILVKRDRVRLALAASDEGCYRLELRFGDRHLLGRELLVVGLLKLPNGFLYFDEEQLTIWVIDASEQIIRSAGRIDAFIQLTPEEIPAIVPWILSRAEGLGATIDGGAALREDELEVVLQLERDGEDVTARLGLAAPQVDRSLFFHPGQGGTFIAGAAGDVASIRPRDPAVERAHLRRWLDGLDEASCLANRWTEDGGASRLEFEDALLLLQAAAEQPDLRLMWTSKRNLGVRKDTVGSDALRLRLSEGMDHFLLTGSLSLDARQVTLGELFDAIRRGRRFVEVDRDVFAAIDEELRDRLASVDAVAVDSADHVAVPAVAAHRLLDLATLTPQVELTDRLIEARDRVERARALRPEVDPRFKASLRDYQREGVVWALRLAELGLGGCLADDMGLGKTVQALAVLVARAEKGPALVVAPTSVMNNWLRDGERFAPSLRIRLYHGSGRALGTLEAGEVVVTSYGVVRQDQQTLAERRFATIVFDEAQALKSADSRTSRAARLLDAEWRLALTGTPVENHAGELWSLFELLAPGMLGSKKAFAARFGPSRDAGEETIRRRRLALAIRPLVLRRTKAQVLPQLPPKTEVRVDVLLSAAEQRLYDAVRMKALARLHDARPEQSRGQRHLEVLSVLMQLRQLSCHPRLFEASSPVASSKHARLHDLLDELVAEGRQVLVFSQFVRQLDLVADVLAKKKIRYERLVGETSLKRRLEAIERFSEGDAPVFLVSLKAGGVGLNLTAADTVIFLDPWWNPAVEAQAADRAHRIGQVKPVTIYRLVACGTLEEEVMALQDQKKKLVEDVLDGTDHAASLDTDDLLKLIGKQSA